MDYINFSILAHIDAGKTTTTDRILYLTGNSSYIGNVDEGTALTDYLDEERERGISIVSGIANASWNEKELQIIDTPGHIDFIGEVIAPLSVVDNSILVVCGIHGIETQTEIIWKILKKRDINKFIFINKLDREQSNFYSIVENLKNRLNITPLVLTIPYYENDSLAGIIDILKQKYIQFENGFISKENDIPEAYRDISAIYYEDILDLLSKYDDMLLSKTLDGTVSEKDIESSIKNGVSNDLFIPIFSGSALKNIGISLLLDDATKYFSYSGSKNIVQINKNSTNPIVLYIFKIIYDKSIGNLFLARVYSGEIERGMTLYNPKSRECETIKNIYTIFVDSYIPIDSVETGVIAAFDGFHFSKASDTLCDVGNDITLENSEYPEPVIHQKLIPKDYDSYERFEKIASNLILTEPCLSITNDKESGYLTIGGMGELHIDVFLNRLKREHDIEFRVTPPEVAFRIKPKGRADIEHQTRLTIDEIELLLNISLEILPIDEDKNSIIFDKKFFADEDSTYLLDMMESGIERAIFGGSIYPLIGSNIVVKNIVCNHNDKLVNNSILEFASYNTVMELVKKLETTTYEPIMSIVVVTPENFTGVVLGDLHSRDIKVRETIYDDGDDIIDGSIFLKNMFGYSTTLRNITKGKATFTLVFDRWGDSL